MPYLLVHRKLEEVHQNVEAPFVEGPEVVSVELRVLLGVDAREESVLAGAEGQPRYVLPGDRLAVQRYASFVVKETEYAFYERGLACAVGSEQPYYLAGADVQGHSAQSDGAAVQLRKVFYLYHINALQKLKSLYPAGMLYCWKILMYSALYAATIR